MNLTTLLDMAADGGDGRAALTNGGDGVTAADLRAAARHGAAVLMQSGAPALVYLAKNGPAFPVALFAAAVAGVPFVPLNYRLGAEPLSALLANHPRAYVVADEQHDAVARPVASGLTTPEAWLARTAKKVPGRPVREPAPDATAVVIYTSGTTSTPKPVSLRHDNLVSYVIGTVEFGSAGPDEASLSCVPPYHVAGVAGVLSNLYAGRRLVFLDPFTPRGWLDLVNAEQITGAMVVPTMLARVMEDPGPVPSLRTLAYGGAAMPPRVIERALREWPSVGFVNAYGLTETSSTISVLGPDDHRDALASTDPKVRARLHSVGRPVPGVEIEIRDTDVLPAGESGLIWVRGAQVAAGGWFDTRDLGHLDADGYLFVEGRVDDTIIKGAENISPAEIEDVLRRQDGVADAVVVGVPDDEWGQRIEAVVTPERGAEPDPELLREAVRLVLRGSRTPDRVTVWAELPRTDTGKVRRRDVVATLCR
ncbi:class I adenylate-forming enzyme family protein [Actinophytocola oryzae]|uniref:Acyl-CoA synthetase (AMP-forming)/AMP-acid ligase II n=1 Tax=Actinophytocola oryzae TaxID=502181 RepID=A0A4R7W0D6_9PSEU|nr:class I adenylate-forming enzyme family protein [Actinophytocola oryzae]TDV55966.1 acyl-CoA synthetase (AMP-forming)/AMP-acid ligase II [Actinophytocola oryzae]